MRVVLLTTDLRPGGAPLRLARLARLLAARDVTVHVGCLSTRGPVSDALEADGIATFACDARDRFDLAAIPRLGRALAAIRPDLVHATLTHANVAARATGWALRIPVIGSTATIEQERSTHRVLERNTISLDAAHLVNSRAVRDHVCEAFGAPPERVYVVPPLVRTDAAQADRNVARARLGVRSDAFVLGWMGRFDPAKRSQQVVACLAKPGCEDALALLVGDGPLRDSAIAMAEYLGVRDRATFPGWLDRPWELLAAADVLLLPSLTEGMPNAALEALSAGIPVIGSDIPALRELAEDGAPVLLAPQATAESLSRCVESLRQVPAELAARGARARRWAAARLDSGQAADATLDVYEQVLRARLTRRSRRDSSAGTWSPPGDVSR